jgi:hypothetical protein
MHTFESFHRSSTFARVLGAVLAALVAVVLVFSGFWALLGAKRIYWNHAVVTFELRGLQTDQRAESFAQHYRELAEVREVKIARSPLTDDRWLAKIAFHADNLAGAGQRIRDWVENPPEYAKETRLVRATFYPCRVIRSHGGDMVFGSPSSVTLNP